MSGDQDSSAPGASSRQRAGRSTRAIGGLRVATSLPRAVREALPARRLEALEVFYDAFFDRIHRYVRRMVRDEHLAEDLTQDIFMSIHRALPIYDPARDLAPWVFTIATNKLRDLWQSRGFQQVRRQVSLDDDNDALAAPVPAPEPGDSLEGHELAAAVAAALESLPESLRVPFWLRWHEGLPFKEIADQLGRSEVAVRKRYSRALAELRRLLAGWLPTPARGATRA